jgi:hypothetical protein
MAQHGMWRELMHDNIQFVALQERLAHVDAAERQATQVYARWAAPHTSILAECGAW